jgi:hypothetical protein
MVMSFISCNEKEANTAISPAKQWYDQYNDEAKLKQLKSKIQNGDTIAFNEMQDIYILSDHANEFLYYSIYMAQVYEYSEAYNTAYFILHTDTENAQYEKLDKTANYYLLKAYELGNISAKNAIQSRFPDGEIPNSKDYLNSIELKGISEPNINN